MTSLYGVQWAYEVQGLVDCEVFFHGEPSVNF